MGMTATERSRLWRAKHGQKGGRQLSVWIDGDTARRLDELAAESSGALSDLIGQAIALLHEKNLSIPQPPVIQPKLAFETPAEPSLPPTPPEPIPHQLLQNIRAKLDQGENIAALRPLLAAAATKLAATGLSGRKIAALFNEAGLPTFSGAGGWGKSTVLRLLQGTSG
jgi:hypothetical protein